MKRLANLLAILSLTCIVGMAQNYKTNETTSYITKYHKTAIREMYQHNIPASITLAQGILESGSGKSDLAIKANNHFGIKCSGDYSGKKFYKDDDKKNDCFRVYLHADESFADHSVFLKKPRYAELFKLKQTDYKGWAKGLKKAGYATNPKYPDLLVSIIEQNELYEYDKHPEKYISKKEAEEYSLLNGKLSPNGSMKDNVVIAPMDKTSKINGLKYIQVRKGDTFYGLSNQTGIAIADLMKFNDFPSNYSLKVGENLFLEKKKKKSNMANTHIVRKGESWLSISQIYGIQKKHLKKMNHAKGEKISVGQSLRLR